MQFFTNYLTRVVGKPTTVKTITALILLMGLSVLAFSSRSSFTSLITNSIQESKDIIAAVFPTSEKEDNSLFAPPPACSGSANTVAGFVWQDVDYDGVKDNNEIVGVQSVNVEIFDDNGSVGTDQTDADGNWSIDVSGATTSSGNLRLEYTNIPTWAQETGIGTDNGSSLQFVQAGDCANLGVAEPVDYNTGKTNTQVYVPCYVNGNPLGGGSSGTTDWFVGFPYNNSGTNTAPAQKLDGTKIGATWGVAYSRQAQKIFTSAFIKRHVGLGDLGSGGIYLLEPTASSFTASDFYDLDANGHRTRANSSAPNYGSNSSYQVNSNVVTYLGSNDPLTGKPSGLGVVGINGSGGRDLPDNSGGSNADPAAFDQVGKVGLGDLDISDDGKFLFVTNLYSRRIFRLALNDASNPTSVTSVMSWAVDDIPSVPSCTDGVLRPFGLKFYRGKLYIGAVCTNEDRATSIPNNSDLSAHVFVLNNAVGASPSFASGTVVSQTLDFNKGRSRGTQSESFPNNNWNSWTNDFLSAFGKYSGPQQVYPTPMLSDIEFSDEGNMVMVFSDRAAHQYGADNNDLNGNNTFNYQLGGHALFVEGKNDGSFEIESDGQTTNFGVASSIRLNGEGPGGGEFFSGMYYNDNSSNNNPYPPNPFVGNHPSTTMGSAAVLAGTDELFMTAMDPAGLFQGGTLRVNFSNGGKVVGSGYKLYEGGRPFFSKAAGLGDIELSAELAPLSVGNFVWDDSNGNGIQDAGETGIDGLVIELFKDDGSGNFSKVAEATSSNGFYGFSSAASGTATGYIYGVSGLSANMNYELRFPTMSGSLPISTNINNGGSDAGADLRDTDANAGGVISFTTSTDGESDYSFDVAYSSSNCNSVLLATLTCEDDAINTTSLSDYIRSCSNNVSVAAFWTNRAFEDIIPQSGSCSFNQQSQWSIVANSNPVFEEYANGKALIKILVESVCDANKQYEVVLTLSGRTFSTPSSPSGSPNFGASTNCVDNNTDVSDWYYYTDMSGLIIGRMDLAGLEIQLDRNGPSLQVGTGANQFNENGLGLSSWFTPTILSQPTSGPAVKASNLYDINVEIDQNALTEEPSTSCYEICDNGGAVIITATPQTGQAPYTYNWSTGETTSSITATAADDYMVTITDADGCTTTLSATVTTKDCNGPACDSRLLATLTCEDDALNTSSISSYIRTCTNSMPRVAAFTTSEAFLDIIPSQTGCSYNDRNRWSIVTNTPAVFEEYANGTALIRMLVENNCDADKQLEVVLTLSGRTFNTPSGSPNFGAPTTCVHPSKIPNLDVSDWYYYTTISGLVVGKLDLVGLQITLDRSGPAVQVGTGGNQFNATGLGLSSWFNQTILSQPDMGPDVRTVNGNYDINIDIDQNILSEEPSTTCYDICENNGSVMLAATPQTGEAPYTYSWSTGETTSSITATAAGTYIATITDANECVVVVSSTVNTISCGDDGDCADAVQWMSEYSLIAFGDLNSVTEIEGSAIIGGDYNIANSIQVGNELTTANYGNDLSRKALEVAGGVVAGSSINVQNYSAGFVDPVVYNSGVQGTVQDKSNGQRTVSIQNGNDPNASLMQVATIGAKVSEIEADIQFATDQLCMQTTTSNVVFDDATQNATLTVTDNNAAVLTLSATEAASFFNTTTSFDVITPNNATYTAPIIINVKGTDYSGIPTSFDATTINIALWDNIVWNFCEATAINITTTVKGSLLAPNADVTLGGNIDGVLVANDVDVNSESHLPFLSADFSSLCGSGFTCVGNVGDIPSAGAVVNTQQLLGAPDGSRAEFDANGSFAVLRLEEKLTAGATVDIVWRKANAGGNDPQVEVTTSADGGSFTPVAGSLFTVSSTSYVTATINITSDTRFIRIENDNGEDLDIDGLSYATNDCMPDDTFLDCAAGQLIESVAKPIVNQTCISLAEVSLSPSDVETVKLIAFVRVLSGSQPQVRFTSDNGFSTTLPFRTINAGDGGNYYITDVPGDGVATEYCVELIGGSPNDAATFQAVITYDTPNMNAGGAAFDLVGEFVWWLSSGSIATPNGREECLLRTLPLATGNQATKDVTVGIVLDDFEQNDPRTAEITVTAGSVVETAIFSAPSFSDGEVGIIELTLFDVPQNITEVDIEICTRQANNGQSLYVNTLFASINTCDEELGAIGNYVWLDENSDGAQDVGESGIPNVQVDLKDINGNVIATTYTDQN
ncbi:MAG: collagen-binding domain-containing protein, partial [Bacteroidota bacterium]